MPKVGVCLSGCGFQDGSEIHEATLTLLALDMAGAQVQCMAPDVPQSAVMDHMAGKPVKEQRNALVESARIARGKIERVALVNAGDLDALIFPGGFGAAKNLSTFAADGAQCSIDPDVEMLIDDMVDEGKPIGAICIAPALVARALANRGIKAKLTIGNDSGVAEAIESMGHTHVECKVTDHVVDETHKIVTTPAYMYNTSPAEVWQGVKKLVDEVLKLCSASAAK